MQMILIPLTAACILIVICHNTCRRPLAVSSSRFPFVCSSVAILLFLLHAELRIFCFTPLAWIMAARSVPPAYVRRIYI